MATVQLNMLLQGLLEKSRSGIMDGLRTFIAVDNYEAVKVGGLHQDTKS